MFADEHIKRYPSKPLCHLRIAEHLHHLILVCIGAIHYRIINSLQKITQACSDE
ncbi:hypothetical protein [Amphritea sp. HPY]|uniref:hypothetical protein n=1 Tax=Amphritea sp. HPY TaxID=3421652 RepID=UPI003D7DC605